MDPVLDDGGPAFPVVTEEHEVIFRSSGMSLRQYYIGQLVPVIAIRYSQINGLGDEDAVNRARRLADAMIKAGK